MPTITNPSTTADAVLTGLSIFNAKSLLFDLINIPIEIGIITITKIWAIVLLMGNWIISPASKNSVNAKFTINGIVIMVIKLLTAVRETDNAVSPFS